MSPCPILYKCLLSLKEREMNSPKGDKEGTKGREGTKNKDEGKENGKSPPQTSSSKGEEEKCPPNESSSSPSSSTDSLPLFKLSVFPSTFSREEIIVLSEDFPEAEEGDVMEIFDPQEDKEGTQPRLLIKV